MAKRTKKPKEPPSREGLATEPQIAELVALLIAYPAAFTRRERAKALLNFARQPEPVAVGFLARVGQMATAWLDNPTAYWHDRYEADGSKCDYMNIYDLNQSFYG